MHIIFIKIRFCWCKTASVFISLFKKLSRKKCVETETSIRKKLECKSYDNNILLDEITDILKSGGEVVLRIKGNSMLPFIRSDIDSVLLKCADTYIVGDIVLANVGQKECRYVLHRIFSMDGDKVTLMGDGNCAGKEYCTLNNISGKVLSVIRPSGRTLGVSSGRLWKKLLPIRRYLLFIYRRLPDCMK